MKALKKIFSVTQKENGKGPVCFCWEKRGNFLAVCGPNLLLRIYTRQGKIFHETALVSQERVIGMEWDDSGDYLAIIQRKNSVVHLWNINSKSFEKFDTNCRELTLISWSRTGPELAIGGEKGTLVIYNKKTLQSVSVKGKLTKSIRSGGWNLCNNYLAISDDSTISINNSKGDTVLEQNVRFEPKQIQFLLPKKNEKDSVLIANLGDRTIWIYNYLEKDEPKELSFPAKYGRVASFAPFGDSSVMVGFKNGLIAIISIGKKEFGKEITAGQFFDKGLSNVRYSDNITKGASTGGNVLLVFPVNNLNKFGPQMADRQDFGEGMDYLDNIEWTPDGQILTVSSRLGDVHTFITSLPVLHDHYQNRVLFMTSLQQLCIKDVVLNKIITKFSINVEPSFIALGTRNVAVGLNNSIWYYRLLEKGKVKYLGKKEYLGSIEDVKIQENYVAVKSLGKVVIQLIEQDKSLSGRTELYFPLRGGRVPRSTSTSSDPGEEDEYGDDENQDEISSFAVTSDFLVYSTKKGSLVIFSFSSWCVVNEFRNDIGITAVFPNPMGTRIVFLDESHQAFFYNPFNDKCILLDHVSGSVDQIIWDIQNPDVFITSDKARFVTYVCSKYTMKGEQVRAIPKIMKTGPHTYDVPKQFFTPVEDGEDDDGESGGGILTRRSGMSNLKSKKEQKTLVLTKGKIETAKVLESTPRPEGFVPIMLVNGMVISQMANGYLALQTLMTHTMRHDELLMKKDLLLHPVPTSQLTEKLKNKLFLRFYQDLCLSNFTVCWELAFQLNDKGLWYHLADSLLHNLEVATAIKVFRHLEIPEKVLALEPALKTEELNVLIGHLALLREDYREAEFRFLRSSQKERALALRRDLMNWDRALQLAEQFDKTQIPGISRSYASHLEIQGDVENAYHYYEKARRGDLDDPRHQLLCKEGLTRSEIKRGNYQVGIRLAMQSSNPKLCFDCAKLFEQVKYFNEASELYIKADMHEKAAELNLFVRNYRRVEKILESGQVDNPKIYLKYAEAMEKERKFEKSAHAYGQAKDIYNQVRVYLLMGDVSRPIEIVRYSRSVRPAEIIAEHCVKIGNWERAIEFLVIAEKSDQAFEISKRHKQVSVYAKVMKEKWEEQQVKLKQQVEARQQNQQSPSKKNMSFGGTLRNSKDFLTREDKHTRFSARLKKEFLKIAKYFEENKLHGDAGDYYLEASEVEMGLHNYFKCGSTRLPQMIQLCGKLQSAKITNHVLSFILGEVDGKSKGLKYLFDLYLIVHNYKRAIETCFLITDQEREEGNYENAKKYLFILYRELRKHKVHVPEDVIRHLSLLQGYIMVRTLAKMGNNELAARCLVSVANEISLFPKHKAVIYASTALYCIKANLKHSAFQFALPLVQKPELRKAIQKGLGDKLFRFVRKFRHKKEKEMSERPKFTECVYCRTLMDPYQLNCSSCQGRIPFCVVTIQHMVRNDWTQCPSCKFHARYSLFTKLLKLNNSVCPMCMKKVDAGEVKKIVDVESLVQEIRQDEKIGTDKMMENSDEEFEEEEGDGLLDHDDDDDEEEEEEERRRRGFGEVSEEVEEGDSEEEEEEGEYDEEGEGEYDDEEEEEEEEGEEDDGEDYEDEDDIGEEEEEGEYY